MPYLPRHHHAFSCSGPYVHKSDAVTQYAQVPASTKIVQALLRESAAAAPKVDLSTVPLDDGADEWDDDEPEMDLFQGTPRELTQTSMVPVSSLKTWRPRTMMGRW